MYCICEVLRARITRLRRLLHNARMPEAKATPHVLIKCLKYGVINGQSDDEIVNN
jgi:hypothetical protein